MSTLNYILKKFNIGLTDKTPMPVQIPNFGRNQLAQLFVELGFNTGAEIGVEQGEYSEILCLANPKLKLYAIDPWKAYRDYRDHTRQSKLDRFYETTKTRLAPYNCEIIRKFSLDAVRDFPNRSLDFVYIDANHNFQNVTNDIVEWSKKVKINGIISGHDYYKQKYKSQYHVWYVVNALTDAYRIKPWFVLGSKLVLKGQIRDKPRSWMWIKE